MNRSLKMVNIGKKVSQFLDVPKCPPFRIPQPNKKEHYDIISPYSEVVWQGEDAWGAFKGNLHAHSFVSDAEVDYRDMILAHYERDFDFLAMTDHGVTGKPWDEKPTQLPLYLFQKFKGNDVHYFTPSEFALLQSGDYPVNGKPRGRGMLCVTGGNELNALTLTKDHVNGMFLPEHVGDNYLGYENDYEGAVKIAHRSGGLSFLNHPGDWLNTNKSRANCADSDRLAYFADILLRYDSCCGMEVFNEHNGTTGYDRDTWDNLLMMCLPYGKRVIGFSNNDTHFIRDVDSSFSVFMMRENTSEEIRRTMLSGSSFLVTRAIRADKEKFGPDEDLDARDSGLPYPMFSNIEVDGHGITVSFNEAYNLKWIADGKIIASADFTQSAEAETYTIDLDKTDGSGKFTYVRCQLLGSGGITLTQAFVLDDGAAPEIYTRDESFKAKARRAANRVLSLRVPVLIKNIIG